MVPYCLILEPIPLVATDLATTARENLACEPLIAASEAEALRLMEDLGGAALPLALVHETAPGFAASPLRRQLEQRGTKIILLGPEPDSAWPKSDWPALAWPFSTTQLLSLIASLGGVSSRTCAG
jgi:hypothetical protein